MKGSTNGAYIPPIDDLDFRSGLDFPMYLNYTMPWKFNITINDNTFYFVITTEAAESMMNELNTVLTQIGQDPIAEITDIPVALTTITHTAAFWSAYGVGLTQQLFVGLMGETTLQARFIDYTVSGAVNLPIGINAQGINVYSTPTDNLAWSDFATSMSSAAFYIGQFFYVPIV